MAPNVGLGTHDPEIKSLAGHVEFGVMVFARLLLLYHPLLIISTPGRSS